MLASSITQAGGSRKASSTLYTCAPRDYRVPSLTGLRAVAALLVVATHAAYATGKETHGYIGLFYSRLEIGVAIFFVLSGFLLFRPWVNAAATGSAPPSLIRYARQRFRRIMPAYIGTVLLAYFVYQFRTVGPNPGHSWMGLFRHLTLTQIYTDDYLSTWLHHGLTQMWSLAVEVAFYAALPLLAYVLLVVMCRRSWRPMLLLASLGGLAALTPAWLMVLHTTAWLPSASGMWLPAYLMWFAGGMALAVLQAMRVNAYALLLIPVAVIGYLIVSTPIAGEASMSTGRLFEPLAKTVFYAAIATLVVAPLALGDRGLYVRALGSRPMVWLGEISYEIFLIHAIVMDIAMGFVLGWRIYTGSIAGLFLTTLAMTIPPAWALNRWTRQRDRKDATSWKLPPTASIELR
jgi:peptidoglycan/LPS O-acetylase OafA/YrhL